MVTSAKERQKKWKEKQKDKKQVTVMLPKSAYNNMNSLKVRTGENFSKIVDRAIHNLTNPDHIKTNRDMETAGKLTKHSERIEELIKAFTNELSATNQQLREEIAGRINAEKSLEKSEEKFHDILENSYDVIFRANLNENTFEYISPSSKRVFGYYPDELISIGFKTLRSIVHPDDYERFKEHYNIFSARSPEEISSTIEHRIKNKTLGYRWVSHSRTVLFDESQKPVAVIGNVRDIHDQKQADMKLKKLREELEQKVKERTKSLEELNRALKVMLKKEEEVRIEFGDKITTNVKELVLPFIEKMKNTNLDVRQKKYMDTLETSIGEIISPFLHTLTSKFLDLTPGEIQIANLIKNGRTTKEIANLLNLSARTIEFHRANIRSKVGIKNKKTSLRSYLLSIG